MLPAVTKLFLPVVQVVSCFSNDFLACGGRSVTMCFSRNLLRRGYGGQEERKDRKGASRVKELMRGRTKNDIVHVVSSAQKATLPIVSNLNDILTMR